MGRTQSGRVFGRRRSAAGPRNDRRPVGGNRRRTGAQRLIASPAYRAADDAARYAYGRLLAFLAHRSRDLNAAEDALAEAFASALETWPRRGVPAKPEAWLLTAARRRLVDGTRRAEVRERYAMPLVVAAEAAEERAWAQDEFPDERLGMLFACAHPAIDVSVRAPLILRTVLGVDAGRIANAFLVSPEAMRQRLVRAKTKIRAAAIAFEVPSTEDAATRIDDVLQAIYAAFGLSWEEPGIDGRADDLAHEALFLGRTIVELMPLDCEARGLLALMLFVESRRSARRGKNGEYVPLDEQDAKLWSRELIGDAEMTLRRAGTRHIGRFQLEAAIQSAHAERARGRETDWHVVATLYDGLATYTGAVGAAVARAAAHARAFGSDAGLRVLDAIDPELAAKYQPYWAVRAHLTGDAADYDRAIGLCENASTREFLVAKRRVRTSASDSS